MKWGGGKLAKGSIGSSSSSYKSWPYQGNFTNHRHSGQDIYSQDWTPGAFGVLLLWSSGNQPLWWLNGFSPGILPECGVLFSYHISFSLTPSTSFLGGPVSPAPLCLQPGPYHQHKPWEGWAAKGSLRRDLGELSPVVSRIFLGCICPGAEVAKDKQSPYGHSG